MELTSASVYHTPELHDLEQLWESSSPEQRVVVMIQHPNMPIPYESTYGCRFDVQPGDSVLCPPAPLWPEPFVGVVTSLSSNYDGPIKFLIKKVS